MKSWGFLRMRKQWIPGHFSLLPRGLGTRLGTKWARLSLEESYKVKLIHDLSLQGLVFDMCAW